MTRSLIRKAVSAGTGLLLLAAVAACSTPTSAADAPTDSTSGSSAGSLDGKSVADIGNVSNAFMTCMRNNLLPLLEDAGATTSTSFGNFTASGVQAAVEDAITRTPDAALYISESASLDEYSIQRLQGANIPTLLAFGRPSGTADPEGNLAFDYDADAKKVADNLAAQFPGITKVGNIDGQPGIPDTDLQDAALVTALAAHGITIEATLHSGYTAQGGATATQDMLQAHPDIQALIVHADDATTAAAQTMAASEKKVPIVSLINDTPAVVDLVKSGAVSFALVGDTSQWATQIRDGLATIAGGGRMTPGTLEFTVVDKSNADSFHAC